MYNQVKKNPKKKQVSIEEEELIRKNNEIQAKMEAKGNLLEREFIQFEQERELTKSTGLTKEIHVIFRPTNHYLFLCTLAKKLPQFIDQ